MGGNRGIRKIQGGLRQLLAAVAQLFMYLLKSAQPYAVIGLEQLTKQKGGQKGVITHEIQP